MAKQALRRWSGVNPLLTVEPARFRRVFAVDNYLFLERAVEELEVTVGVICAVADTQGVDAPEKFGMLAPNRHPPRIFANVPVYSVERPGGAKNAIIKILFKTVSASPLICGNPDGFALSACLYRLRDDG